MSSKQVSFSPLSTMIVTSRLRKHDKLKLWNSQSEITASKIRWANTIKEVQNIDMNAANHIDATKFMGLERYLSREIQKYFEENRYNYIQLVVKAQHKYSSHDELAEFARSKTRDTVARSHAIGLFYARRHFEESNSNSSRVSKEPKDKILILGIEYKPLIQIKRSKSNVARCA